MIYSILFGAFLSCEDAQLYSQSKTIQLDETIQLPLKSDMIFKSLCIDYRVLNGTEYLFHGSLIDQSISIYNLNDREIEQKISISKNGPNSVGTTPYGFLVHSMDSIFILSHREGLISLIDSSGTVKEKFEIKKDVFAGDPAPWASTTMPMYYDNKSSELIIHTVSRVPKDGDTYSHSTAMLRFNLSTRKQSKQHNYPRSYDIGYWREHSFCAGYISQKIDGSGSIIGFGIDHYLRDAEGKKFIAKSKYLKEFKPIDDSYRKNRSYSNSQNEVYRMGYYSALITDKYRKKYYRIVALPLQEEKIKKGDLTFNYSIIVLDHKLEQQHEYLLPKNLDATMFFLREDGFFMADREAYYNNENLLTFHKLAIP